MNPRLLRRVHLYLGALFAPVLLFFTVTGAWQVYRVNDADKGSGYTPPKIVKTLSAVHKNQTLGGETPKRTAIKAFVFLAALALITTTLLGVVMAFRFTARPITVTLCLLAGIGIPIVLILLGS
jgi:hypothetical protein